MAAFTAKKSGAASAVARVETDTARPSPPAITHINCTGVSSYLDMYLLSLARYLLSLARYLLSLARYLLSLDMYLLSLARYLLSLARYLLSLDSGG